MNKSAKKKRIRKDNSSLCTYLLSLCGASCLAFSISEHHQVFLSPPIRSPCLSPIGQWKWPSFYAMTSHSQRGSRRQLSEPTCTIQWFLILSLSKCQIYHTFREEWKALLIFITPIRWLDHKFHTLECQQHWEGLLWLGYRQNPTLVFQPQEPKPSQG